MPIVAYNSDILSQDPVTVGSIPDFYLNPAAATDTLRRIAGRNLGYDSAMEHGSVDEYRNLSANQQVALTDEMARLIKTYPNSFPQNVQEAAQARVDNPYYQVPLDDPGYISTVMDQLADGTLIETSFGGAASYLKEIGISVAAGLVLFVILNR